MTVGGYFTAYRRSGIVGGYHAEVLSVPVFYDNPVVIAKGIDENGKEFEEKININDIDLRNASYVEMSALEAYYDVDRGNSLSSFPQETGHMGLNERCDLISSFEKVIQDMNKLGKYDLQMFYMRNMNTYLNLERQKKA